MRAIPHASYNRTLWTALAVALLASSGADAEPPVNWKTGAAFTRQLREDAGVTLGDRGLRNALGAIAHAYDVAIFLDRRIDPDQRVDFSASDVPLERLLQQIATVAHAETAVIGSVVYVGPRESAAQLATIAAMKRQEISRLPNDAKARLLKTEAWHSEELAQPRDLLRDLAGQGGVRVENADSMPHDLWPAVNLPPLAWVDRLTLILVGFGMTFELDERASAMRLVPARAATLAERRAPASPSTGSTKSQKKSGEKLYSLNVANEPAGNVVSAVAKSLGKELSYDPELTEKLKQRVTFDLKDATLDYLLETTLKPLGLAYRVGENQLQITTAKK